MRGAINVVRRDLAALRTGRAHTGLVAHVMVEAWGSSIPLEQVAQIGVVPPRGLVVTPHDPSLTPAIVAALQQAELGAMPRVDGVRIRLELPASTQEQRDQARQRAAKIAEAGRVAVRLARRDGINDLRRAHKAGSITQARLNGRSKDLQRQTDQAIAEIDALLDAMVAELGQMA